MKLGLIVVDSLIVGANCAPLLRRINGADYGRRGQGLETFARNSSD
jgi:hypothetical protein